MAEGPGEEYTKDAHLILEAVDKDDIMNVIAVRQRYKKWDDFEKLLMFAEAVHEAARKGSHIIMKNLVHQSEESSFQQRDKRGRLPLYYACFYGNLEAAEVLLEVGAGVYDEEGLFADSPVYAAVTQGHGAVLKLLEEHMDRDFSEDEFHFYFYLACKAGHLNMIKRYYSALIDLNKPFIIIEDRDSVEKPLPFCLKDESRLDAAKFLLTNGAVLNLAEVKDASSNVAKMLSKFYTITDSNLGYCIVQWSNLSLPLFCTSALKLLGNQADVSTLAVELQINKVTQFPLGDLCRVQNVMSVNASRNIISDIVTGHSEEEADDNNNEEDGDAGVAEADSPGHALDMRRRFLLRHSFPETCHLTELDLSWNCLRMFPFALFEIPSLRSLDLSHNRIVNLAGSCARGEERPWKCEKLEQLVLSHNYMERVPSGIKAASALKLLDLFANRLEELPEPWKCPLAELNASQNQLVSLPAKMGHQWKFALRRLFLSHNHFSAVPTSVCQLNYLVTLDLSHNAITDLPVQWSCKELDILDMSHNRLMSRKTDHSTSTFYDSEVFPSNLSFARSLTRLDLSFNQLEWVPPAVHSLTELESLNLSNNGIKSLPPFLGRLKGNLDLSIEGLKITNISSGALKAGSASILAQLRKEYRETVPLSLIKLVLIGAQGSERTELVSKLCGDTKKDTGSSNPNQTHLTIRKFTIDKFFSKRKPVTFHLWNIPEIPRLRGIQQFLLTRNSLYIYAWNLCDNEGSFRTLKCWLVNIQLCASKARVLIVRTNPGPYKDSEAASASAMLKRLDDSCIALRNGWPTVINKLKGNGTSDLRQKLLEILDSLEYESSSTLRGVSSLLVDKEIPQSYMKFIERIETLRDIKKKETPAQVPILTAADLHREMQNTEKNAQEGELSDLAQFLTEAGVILHFPKHYRNLHNQYFIDPEWSYMFVTKIVDSRQEVGNLPPVISKESMLGMCKPYTDIKDDDIYDFLERFSIVLPYEGDSLLIPSRLPSRLFMTKPKRAGDIMRRVYVMASIPDGFWEQLNARILLAIDRARHPFGRSAASRDHHDDSVREGGVSDLSTSYNELFKAHYDHLICRTGFVIVSANCTFMVDTVELAATDGMELQKVALVISVISHATGSGSEKDFSAMGFVVDVIDSLVEEWFPGLLQFDSRGRPLLRRIIPCPQCPFVADEVAMFHLTPDSHHYAYEALARRWLNEESITLAHHDNTIVDLDKLLPELSLSDVNSRYVLDKELLEGFDTLGSGEKLGEGGCGNVYKVKYGDKYVALKVPPIKQKFGQSDSGFQSTDSDMREYNEDRQLHSFKEMRKEVVILCQLKHPNTLGLEGFLYRPPCIALELAPLGDLRKCLDSSIKSAYRSISITSQGEYQYPVVLGKVVTYRILYQIISALRYLHSRSVAHRDLKSDNIIVWSLDPRETVHVKLSDYDIAAFEGYGGFSGIQGTSGYKAPEVIRGSAYSLKVDIFSYAMVTFELLTGLRPFERLRSSAAILQKIQRGERPYPDDISQLQSGMCKLENMLPTAWHVDPTMRPSAMELKRKLRDFTVQMQVASSSLNLYQQPSALWLCTKSNILWVWGTYGPDKNLLHMVDTETATRRTPETGLHPEGKKVRCQLRYKDTRIIGCESNGLDILESEGSSVGRNLGHVVTKNAPLSLLVLITRSEALLYVGQSQGLLEVYSQPTATEHRPSSEPVETISRGSHHPSMHNLQADTRSRNFTIPPPSGGPSSSRAAWKSVRHFQLRVSDDWNPVRCLCRVPKGRTGVEEIWAGCGNALCILAIDHSDEGGQFGNERGGLKEGEVYIPQQDRPVFIDRCVVLGDHIWCSCEKSPKIYQVNVQTRQLVREFTLGIDVTEGDLLRGKEFNRYATRDQPQTDKGGDDMSSDAEASSSHAVSVEPGAQQRTSTRAHKPQTKDLEADGPCVNTNENGKGMYQRTVKPIHNVRFRNRKRPATDFCHSRRLSMIETGAVTDICKVKDTLWVTSEEGHLVVLNVDPENELCLGEVVLILNRQNDAAGHGRLFVNDAEDRCVHVVTTENEMAPACTVSYTTWEALCLEDLQERKRWLQAYNCRCVSDG